MKISSVLHDSADRIGVVCLFLCEGSSLEGLVVLSLAVVQHAELQVGGAVVVA